MHGLETIRKMNAKAAAKSDPTDELAYYVNECADYLEFLNSVRAPFAEWAKIVEIEE